MEALIQQLRREHGAIMYQLGKVHQQGLHTPAGQEIFTQALASLDQHLNREDGEFYPFLRTLAQGDVGLQELLQQTATSHPIHTLRQRFEAILAQLHAPDQRESRDLAGSFRQLQEGFLQRISWEENTLFPKFLTTWRRTRPR